MPEYLAPGVYVEEVSFRAKVIEGVSTTTTGFIGPTRFGPVDLEPEIITSLADFESVYGDGEQLRFGASGDEEIPNFMWHAVRAFFTEGGKRLYVSRVFKPLEEAEAGEASANTDGRARTTVGSSPAWEIRSRFPGLSGKLRVRITLRLGQNVLGQEPDELDPNKIKRRARGLQQYDVVWIKTVGSFPDDENQDHLYLAESYFDEKLKEQTWKFVDPGGGTIKLEELEPDPDPDQSDQIRPLTVTIGVSQIDGRHAQVWSDLALDYRHQRAGKPESVFALFEENPANLGLARSLPIVVTTDGDQSTGLEVTRSLFTRTTSLKGAIHPDSKDSERSIEVLLEGGNDGLRPEAAEYEGKADQDSPNKTGLKSFEDIEDISIVAAPGSTYGYEDGYRSNAASIVNLLINHATQMRYRIAVLDSGNDQTISNVRAMRGKIDSSYAALYYPWVRVLDPITRTEINLPPSGFVAGIYARNDIQRAVYKAPANEVVNLAIGFEQLLNKGQQDVLNPEGVNCFRFFEGRGFRLWGARTVSSDPEWKYVNLRRYFAYLERSIDRGTQWAVFEPNGELLWANIRRTIEDFLLNEWQSGALLGEKPEKAFFVRCDRSTMTQNDLDNGRMIALIGVAALRPAEFVILRIGQWTADRKS